NVMPPPHRLLQAARTLWNLRQFELAGRTRGGRRRAGGAAQLPRPAGRPVRWGLAGIVIANVIGLNLWALHQRSTIAARRDAVLDVAKATFPKISENEIR